MDVLMVLEESLVSFCQREVKLKSSVKAFIGVAFIAFKCAGDCTDETSSENDFQGSTGCCNR